MQLGQLGERLGVKNELGYRERRFLGGNLPSLLSYHLR